MSVTVSLPNPRAFNREAIVLIVGGALSGLVTAGLALVAQIHVPELAMLSFAAMVGLIANLTDPNEGTPILRLVVAIIAGVLWAATFPVHWALGAAVGGFGVGVAFSLTDGESKLDRLISVGFYAIMLVAAAYTSSTLAAGLSSTLPADVLTGAIWGTFLAFAAGIKRVTWHNDELLGEFKDAYADLSHSERDAVAEGQHLYEQVTLEASRGDAAFQERATTIADETSRTLIQLARRAGELRQVATRSSRRNLEQRVLELDERIENTRDKVVARELKATLGELLDQLRVQRGLQAARARVDSRLERCITAMERLHMTLIQTGTDDKGDAIQDSFTRLEQLAEEVQWRNLPVDELLEDQTFLSESSSDLEILDELRAHPVPSDSTSNATVLDTGISPDEPADIDAGGTDGTVSERAHEASVHQI